MARLAANLVEPGRYPCKPRLGSGTMGQDLSGRYVDSTNLSAVPLSNI